jgi:hypothetical protein
MDTSSIERNLRSAESGVILADPRLVSRVVKQHRHLLRVGLGVPHSHCYGLRKAELFGLASPEELGPVAASLPERVVLLPRPKASDLYGRQPPDVLLWLWRAAFHAHVHLAIEERLASGALTDAAVRARIDRIGQTEFDEIRRVLRADDMLLPPHDDRETYVEFAALLLELEHFAHDLVARTFPTLREPEQALAVIAEDVDARALLAASRPAGAPDPRRPGPAKEATTTPTYSALPQLDILPGLFARPVPSAAAAQGLIARADEARAEGNHVRSALLRLEALPAAGAEQAVKLQAAVRNDLEALGNRLDKALIPPGQVADATTMTPWTSSLLPLIMQANARQALRYPVESRLLYDLQRAAVVHERAASAIDVVTWALSLGKRPVVRKLPATRTLQVARHLRNALEKLRHVEMPTADRKLLARLLRWAVHRAEDNVRRTLRPVIAGTLDAVGLKPQSLPERVARAKLVEELCDQAVSRGFLSIGQLRDALSRSQVKLADLSGPGELWRGDPLLLADRSLDVSLDGVYRRGEIYLRGLQKLSSTLFGTMVGRLLVLFVILPVGGAFVLLEGLSHMLAPVAKWFDADPPHLLGTASLILVSALLLGLIHSATVRLVAKRFLSFIGAALGLVFVRLPGMLLSLPPIRRALESGAVRAAMRFVIVPLALATALYLLTPLHELGSIVGPLLATAVFLGASVLLNTRAGLVVQELIADKVAVGWETLKRRAVPGLVRLVLATFRAMIELLERTLYRVDEWLRFREGDRTATIPVKAALGLVWFFAAYAIRIYVTLLIEPQINPLKYVPVGAVAHKIFIPFGEDLLRAFNTAFKPLGAFLGGTLAAVTAFFFPSVFAFLVWEFKENYRLYNANRSHTLTPVPIGHHGETVSALLRPGFHSGTLPKLYAKLRRAARRAEAEEARGAHKSQGALRGFQEELDDVKEALRHAVDREVVGLLSSHRRFRAGKIGVRAVELGSNRLRIELSCDKLSKAPCVITFEEQSGLMVAGVVDAGFVELLPAGDDRVLFENAIAGLYRMAGVDLVREQIRDSLGEDVAYDVADEGLVVWPDRSYRTEIVYSLDVGFAGPIVPPVVRGDPPPAAPSPLDLRKVLFRDQHIAWADWVRAWSEERPETERVPRVLFGASILPAPRGERPRAGGAVVRVRVAPA